MRKAVGIPKLKAISKGKLCVQTMVFTSEI